MKILRAKKQGQAFYAELCGEMVRRIEKKPYDEIRYTGDEYSLYDVEILAPCEPTKIVAVGLNYIAHANEMKETQGSSPIIFLKPATSVLANNQSIVYPRMSKRVDYEAELGVVIGKTCKNVAAVDANDYIFGYTPLNDVTARDLQKVDGQWTRAKSFDTFCPFGPYIYTDFDPSNRRVTSVLNGEMKQDGNSNDMRFGAADLICFISECMTLNAGDVIATGTPAGIGPMQKGDTIEIRIEGMETLTNTVI